MKAALLFGGAAGCAGEEVLNPVELTSSSSSSTGEGGGGSGGGGNGGAGGTGGVACLDASAFADLFSIEAPDLCAVAIFDAAVDLGGFAVPTWGRHGGPVTVTAGGGGSLEVVRWEVPAGSMGSLTPTTTPIPAGIPADAFPGAQAIDLPFFSWTAVSWGGAFPSTEGEVILAKEAAIEQRYDVQSFFSGVGVASGPGQGRLLYTALSPLEDPAVAKSALYAADSCGAEGDQPRLLPAGDPACGPPIEVAAWGEFSGPVAADRDGNVFTVMSSFSTNDQEARGFAASSIARGEPPAPGDLLFKLPGFGMSLSVLAPEAPGGAGLVAFQPSDGVAGPLDVIGQRYRVETAIKPEGSVETLLKLAKPATSLALLTDADERLWVGCPASGATRFVVLGRAASP